MPGTDRILGVSKVTGDDHKLAVATNSTVCIWDVRFAREPALLWRNDLSFADSKSPVVMSVAAGPSPKQRGFDDCDYLGRGFVAVHGGLRDQTHVFHFSHAAAGALPLRLPSLATTVKQQGFCTHVQNLANTNVCGLAIYPSSDDPAACALAFRYLLSGWVVTHVG
jgi:hypothetical protein